MDHQPVMVAEVLEWLAIRPDGMYLDTTCGLGGHTAAIAERLDTGKVLACDRDPVSLIEAKRNVTAKELTDRVEFHHTAFSDLPKVVSGAGRKANGLLADLGVSRYQLTAAERGFSILTDGPLDMRMDPTQELTAADLVNYSSEAELTDIVSRLGEQKREVRKIVRALLEARPLATTGDLAGVVSKVVPRTGKLHPATLVFQGFRRKVNDEEGQLQALLDALPEIIAPQSRAVFLTYHSLEDRPVKRALKEYQRRGLLNVLTKHVLRPSPQEVRANKASRSAKLRAVEFKH